MYQRSKRRSLNYKNFKRKHSSTSLQPRIWQWSHSKDTKSTSNKREKRLSWTSSRLKFPLQKRALSTIKNGNTHGRRRQWHPTPVLLPGKSHGWRGLVGCSPWGRWGSDTTEWLPFHFSLSCTGEGNGNPLQCSCLENPRDGGAWWAAVYGVAVSRKQLKPLSSSSSRN